MSQELGRVQRPPAAQYQDRRKLLLVPLLYAPQAAGEDWATIVARYWEQVTTQTAALESSLGPVAHVYCESLPRGGEEGLKYLEMAAQPSFHLVKSRAEAGAVLEETEDREAILEMVDLQRMLMLPMASEKVAHHLHQWYTEANHNRYEHIAQKIDATLGQTETGLLLIGERHQVQFPADIEVFYVSPPALDEFRRWLQNWVASQEQPASADGDVAEPDPDPEEAPA